MKAINLHCRCGRSMDYDASVDPDTPPEAVRIEITCCDKCGLGGVGGKTWFDADGKEVIPEWAQ